MDIDDDVSSAEKYRLAFAGQMRSSPYRARKRALGTENMMPSRRPRLEIQKGSASLRPHGKMHRRDIAASCQETVQRFTTAEGSQGALRGNL